MQKDKSITNLTNKNENDALRCVADIKNANESGNISSNSVENSTFSTDIDVSVAENIHDFSKSEDKILTDPVSVNGRECRDYMQEPTELNEDENIFFSKLFPGVSREKIENDENFKLFARLKDKNAKFISLYSDYLDLVDRISASATEKALFSLQNKLSSPGSLACESKSDSFFTKEQVLRMSRAEIAKNYDKIRKSQQNW